MYVYVARVSITCFLHVSGSVSSSVLGKVCPHLYCHKNMKISLTSLSNSLHYLWWERTLCMSYSLADGIALNTYTLSIEGLRRESLGNAKQKELGPRTPRDIMYRPHLPVYNIKIIIIIINRYNCCC